jgi:hypothetical protein
VVADTRAQRASMSLGRAQRHVEWRAIHLHAACPSLLP